MAQRITGSRPPAPLPTTPARDDAAAPQAAQAGQPYTVKKGDTLWKLAQQAYGDGNKWPLLRDANPGAVKMQSPTVAIIQPGATLQIPAAPEGWAPAGAPRQRVTGPGAAPRTEAPAAPAPAANPVAQAFTSIRNGLDQLNAQLKGIPASMRAELGKQLTGQSSAELPPMLQSLLQNIDSTMNSVHEQLDALAPDAQAQVLGLMGLKSADELDQQVLSSLGVAPPAAAPAPSPVQPALSPEQQAQQLPSLEAPRFAQALQAAVARGVAQGQQALSARDLPAVLGALQQDLQASPNPQALLTGLQGLCDQLDAQGSQSELSQALRSQLAQLQGTATSASTATQLAQPVSQAFGATADTAPRSSFLANGPGELGSGSATNTAAAFSSGPSFQELKDDFISKGLKPEDASQMALQEEQQRYNRMLTLMTQLLQMKHEGLKGIAQNLRA